MTTAAVAPMDRWETLPWKHLQRNVFKLQKRIYVRPVVYLHLADKSPA